MMRRDILAVPIPYSLSLCVCILIEFNHSNTVTNSIARPLGS